ncbi:AMP-binding protein [Dehalococcoidia bacterium]|nr:AMP-binding protein [Dehalococcoidia bacterium]
MARSRFGSIYESFEETAKRFSDKPALIYLGRRYSYSQLKEAAERLGAALHKMGMEKGNKAMIYLPNIPQWIIAWLALQRIGAMAIPISPIYTPADIKYIANDSGAEIILCMDTNFGYVTDVLPETNLKKVIVTDMVELLPWWKRFIGKAFDRVPQGKFTLGKNIFTFKSLLNQTPQSLPPHGVEREDIANILYTGGTTGFPKGVPFSNIVFLESLSEQRVVTESLIPRGEDVMIQGGPLFHIIGQALGLGALLAGDTLILVGRVNLDGSFNHIEVHKATSFFGVPAIYRMILDHDRLDHYDLGSLRYCFCAGDILPMEIADRWLRKFGKPIYQGYGATETCGRVSLTPVDEEAPPGSAGRITPLQRVKLVDPDTLEPVPAGEPGELLVSSDHMVTGYWNKPRETAESFITMEGRLWYRTRDVVHIDKKGWLFFLDRSADMIKHKGYRVAAAEVETVLQEHPAVIAACVVGIPDPSVGERIKAFVILKEDVRGITGYELLKWCREKLAPYKVPQYVEFRDSLPKSKVGKLLRREMKAEERMKLEKT